MKILSHFECGSVYRSAQALLGSGALLLWAVGCDSTPSVPPAESPPQEEGEASSAIRAASSSRTSASASIAVPAADLKVAPAGAKRNASNPELCPVLCEHTAKLKCGASTSACLAACEQMLSVPICTKQVKAAYGCMAAHATEHFECGEDGVAAVKEGNCDAEQAAFAACVQTLNQRQRQ